MRIKVPVLTRERFAEISLNTIFGQHVRYLRGPLYMFRANLPFAIFHRLNWFSSRGSKVMNSRFPNGKTATCLMIVTITLLSFLGPMVSFSVSAASAAVIQPNRTFHLPGAPATIIGSSGATIWTSQPYNSPSATPTNYGAGLFAWISSLFAFGGVDFAAPLIMNVYASSTPTSSDNLVVFEVNPTDAGSISPSGNASDAPGSSVSIVATASSGYVFRGLDCKQRNSHNDGRSLISQHNSYDKRLRDNNR